MVIYSKEGTTQGCPLAMLQYACAVYPLITRLKDPSRYKQLWYADDSSCAASLVRLREWLLLLMEIGPELFETAQCMFADLQVTVVLASRFLGGCVGREAEIHDYVQRNLPAASRHWLR